MTPDARISTSLPAHPKTKKLIKRLGFESAWRLVCLFLWVASNRSDGDLSGMSTEDIELAVDWSGDEGEFVSGLLAVGFLEGEDGSFQVHDWEEHNPWAAGSEARSEKAKWAALCKQHGRHEAAKIMPDYASRLLDAVPKSASSTPLADSRSAPSPSPSPSPSPKAKDTPIVPTGDESEILSAYREHLPHCQGVSVLNPKRRRRIRDAIKLARSVCAAQGWPYEAARFWHAYFSECARDPWMRGEVKNPNNPNWKQNLDVLIAEDRFAGVMDRAIERLKAAA